MNIMDKLTRYLHPGGYRWLDGNMLIGPEGDWVKYEEVSQLEGMVEAMHLINLLTEDEVSSVTIHHPNPDFDGPNFVIDYCPPVYPYHQSESFYGETLIECLQKAWDKFNLNSDVVDEGKK